MKLDERWIWVGDAYAPEDLGVSVFRAHPGAWWITTSEEMFGPFDDRTILRALRVGCMPVMDGCEKGPPQAGYHVLSPKLPLARGPGWQSASEHELPPSVTAYTREALAPLAGCCTVFDAMPKVAPLDESFDDAWRAYFPKRPRAIYQLRSTWNAHPRGSWVFSETEDVEHGFVVVDQPKSSTRED